MKTLADGTPYLATWERQCATCGMWCDIVEHGPMPHANLGDVITTGMCSGGGYRGRRRLNVSVAKQRRPHPQTGAPQWDTFTFINPSREQRAEIRELL